MDIPPVPENFDSHRQWQQVKQGQAEPTEWQAALMALVEKALASGIFYTKDLDKYMREHAEFVPPAFWDVQFSRHAVEGGVMGMEVYHARQAVEARKYRADVAAATARVNPQAGQALGTLKINCKRVTSAKIIEVSGNLVKVIGKRGTQTWEYHLNPLQIERCIQGAVQMGWRK